MNVRRLMCCPQFENCTVPHPDALFDHLVGAREHR
jgi:hypothetical protein